jgi:hypothetical protein
MPSSTITSSFSQLNPAWPGSNLRRSRSRVGQGNGSDERREYWIHVHSEAGLQDLNLDMSPIPS